MTTNLKGSAMKTPQILTLQHGLHHRVPPAIYHEQSLGLVSKTALDKLHQSPLHYKAWIDGKEEGDQAPALVFGNRFHCALLEPDRFADDYVVAPDFGDLRFKENKALREVWKKENEGKVGIAAADNAAFTGMVRAIHSHPLASKMVRDGEPEVTVRWRDEETGLECKCRADYYVATRRMVVDVKSAEDASYDAFRRSVANYRYHVQDAIYRSAFGAIGAPVDYFVFVVVEKKPPFAVATYTLDADGIQRGYAHARRDIDELAECMRNNEWPGYPVTIQTLNLPPWAA